MREKENKDDPVVVLLGKVDYDGILATVKTNKAFYIRKILASSLDNWHSINKIIERDDVTCVVVKFDRISINTVFQDSYSEKLEQLLGSLRKKRHIVFLHDAIFDTAKDDIEVLPPDKGAHINFPFNMQLWPGAAKYITDVLARHELDFRPYTSNAELSVVASDFVEQCLRNLIFRIYVPKGKLWSAEAEKFIQMFRDYLNKVSGLKVNQKDQATSSGVTYELFAERQVDEGQLSSEFQDFTNFMDLVVSDPAAAASQLTEKGLDSKVVNEIVTRYAKEARRLQLDIRQEREAKTLSIRHRMESELNETGLSSAQLDAIVSSVLPPANDFSMQALLSPTVSTNVNIFADQYIGTLNGFAVKQINGTANFGEDASKILDLVEKYGGKKRADLTAAIHQIEDVEASKPVRLSAKQKVLSFLSSIPAKAEGVALGVLQSYIEHKIGL